MVKLSFINMLLLLILTNKLYALDDSSFKNGWYWGKDDKQEINNKYSNFQKEHKTIIKPSLSNQEILNEIRSSVEESKATAILNPTVSNMVNYLVMQNKMINLATNFSAVWQKAQLLHPELDYSAKNPTNNYVRQLINSNERENIEQSIYKFAKTKGLLFFFNGKDNVAIYQSKIIKEFCTKYNIAVIPVVMDDAPNAIFPNAVTNKDQASKLNITVTPAMVALDVITKEASPIAYGVLTELELKNKIHNFIMENKYDKAI